MRKFTIFNIRLCVVAYFATLVYSGFASENVPRAPFAQWADVPRDGQFIVGLFYDESEAYHIWAKNTYHNVTVNASGEEYGIDINQGWVSLQYGITEKWAADVEAGFTTAAWRYFSNDGNVDSQPRSTTGLMDTALGLRYQIFNETNSECPWTPTLTARAGAVFPGTFNQSFPFAPGNRSQAIEPGLILRKHFGWPGLGVYGDALYRWNRTTHNDLYIASVGFFQQIKGWELDGGYRRLGTTTGEDITLDPATRLINYPIKLRENNNAIEAGFSYTTSKRHFQYGFYSRTVFGGANTDAKFWIGGYINIPIGGK